MALPKTWEIEDRTSGRVLLDL